MFPNEENRNRANLWLAVLEETKENKIVSNVNCVVSVWAKEVTGMRVHISNLSIKIAHKLGMSLDL